jgi:hypothetical protein
MPTGQCRASQGPRDHRLAPWARHGSSPWFDMFRAKPRPMRTRLLIEEGSKGRDGTRWRPPRAGGCGSVRVRGQPGCGRGGPHLPCAGRGPAGPAEYAPREGGTLPKPLIERPHLHQKQAAVARIAAGCARLRGVLQDTGGLADRQSGTAAPQHSRPELTAMR